jgi:hypothetical protein
MQCDRKFNRAQAGPEVATGLRDDINQEFPHIIA